MFPTTTIVTKNRIYVPMPKDLEPAFQISEGTKEFYVRFDTIPWRCCMDQTIVASRPYP